MWAIKLPTDWFLYEGLVLMSLFSDDGRATNPSSTQEAIAQVRPRFPTANGNASPLGIVGGLFRGSHPHFFVVHDIQIVENFENKSESGNSPSDDREDIELVREAKRNVPEPMDFSYSERDVVLYNLSVGATEQELHWSYENHEEFAPLPTFGVVPQFLASNGPSDFLPDFNPVRSPRAFDYESGTQSCWCSRTHID